MPVSRDNFLPRAGVITRKDGAALLSGIIDKRHHSYILVTLAPVQGGAIAVSLGGQVTFQSSISKTFSGNTAVREQEMNKGVRYRAAIAKSRGGGWS